VALRWKQEGQLAPPVQVEVWNTTSWRQQRSFTVSGTASCYEVSPEGRWLAAGDFRGPIRMWSLTGSPETRTISAARQTHSLVFSPNGKLLAAATLNGVVRVWQMPELKELKPFRASAHSLFALAFSPDSRRLATAGEGQEAIKLWEVASWQELITLSRDGETLSDLRFSADGNQLIARSPAGDLLFWRVPSFAEIEAEEENGKGR
jgi:WD40 repeat protein